MLSILMNSICRTACWFIPQPAVGGGCSLLECCAAVYIYRKVANCCSTTAAKVKSCCSVPVIGVSECFQDLGEAITTCCHYESSQPTVEALTLPTAHAVEMTGHQAAFDQV